MRDNEVWRVNTGIKELDKYIEGGFPKNSFIVVTGVIGSGRSIFSYQFLQAGAEYDEKSLLIATNNTSDNIISQAKQFRWNFKKMVDNDMLKIHYIGPEILSKGKQIDEIERLLKKDQYDRLVIDNLTRIICGSVSEYNIIGLTEWGWQRLPFYEVALKNVARLMDLTSKYEVTSVGISQKMEGRPGDTFDTISEHWASGLIVLNNEFIDEGRSRTLRIKKLRLTNLKIVKHEFTFTEKGISLINERSPVDIYVKDKRTIKDTKDVLKK